MWHILINLSHFNHLAELTHQCYILHQILTISENSLMSIIWQTWVFCISA